WAHNPKVTGSIPVLATKERKPKCERVSASLFSAPSPGENLRFVFMKLLVIRFSSIGDIVLTTPVIRCLKQQLPHAEIHYLTKSVFAPLITTNPYIDKQIYLNDNLPEVVEMLKKEKYTEIIDLHHNLRTLRIK